MSNKQRYLDNLEKGQIIAFAFLDKTLSGKVTDVEELAVNVEAKNGQKFIVAYKDILWVKTGNRWPKGVYIALKRNEGDMHE